MGDERKDPFADDWLVSEYVYNNDGSFAGIVRQRRRVIPQDDGTILVWQSCAPEASLSNHPMGAFAGEWEFTLTVEGRVRRYHGPEVLGTGLQWIDGVMTGLGTWPNFGHSFTSFGALVHPERQITGGKFLNGAAVMANIVGLAVPEATGSGYPDFSGAAWPGEVAEEWHGTSTVLSAAGEMLEATALTRQYGPDRSGWWDRDGKGKPRDTIELAPHGGYDTIEGSGIGTGKQSGAQYEMTLVTGLEGMQQTLTLLDNETQTLIEIRRWLHQHRLDRVEIIRLSVNGVEA